MGQAHITTKPLHKIAIAIGSFGGIGFVPSGAGTVATVATIPLYYWLARNQTPEIYLATLIGIVLIGIAVSQLIDKAYGGHDNRRIVIDEVAGYLTTMLWLPFGWGSIIVGAVFFRLFDIMKPPPVGYIDRNIKGGWGVMFDDLVAGIMANLATRLILHITAGASL